MGNQSYLLLWCLGGAHFSSITHLSEDKKGDKTWEHVSKRMCVSEREIAQDLAAASVWGCLLLIWHLPWLKSTCTHTHKQACGRRCAHAAGSSSSEALTAGRCHRRSLPSARGTADGLQDGLGTARTRWRAKTPQFACLCQFHGSFLRLREAPAAFPITVTAARFFYLPSLPFMWDCGFLHHQSHEWDHIHVFVCLLGSFKVYDCAWTYT